VESLEDLLPSDVVNRPKMGFVMPWETWMRGELRTTCERGLQSLKDRPWVQADALTRMERDFMQGGSTWSWSRVWSLVVLGDYLERHGLE
jgi:asparagine synthase (glutamine-hydrolysing)